MVRVILYEEFSSRKSAEEYKKLYNRKAGLVIEDVIVTKIRNKKRWRVAVRGKKNKLVPLYQTIKSLDI